MGIIQNHLLNVKKPGRYTGAEYNQIKKEWSGNSVKFALAFPDIYEIGMSHLGSRIIYHILNSLPYVICERVFAPWIDMEEILRHKNILLFSLESHKPLKDFDILGFSLGYELNYTNVLNMLALAGIEIFSNKRVDGPIVIAGGLGAFSPEPMAPFIDAFVIGDGEEAVVELAEAVSNFKNRTSMTRREKLSALSRIEGVYVPEFFDKKTRIKKRVVKDIDSSYYPVDVLVPYIETVHDRYSLEIMRGCTRGCRFCQAGFLYRPVRERSVERLLELARNGIKRTGYEEISLVSLSSADYSRMAELLKSLNLANTSVSLPSLHIENLTPEFLNYLAPYQRNIGFTLAPETGDVKLCSSINKKFDYSRLMGVIKNIFETGYQKLKLYFMLGLPHEDMSSVKRIYELVSEIAGLRPRPAKINISISVSNFIPKPHTPFQWEKMEALETLQDKQLELERLLRKIRNLKFGYHNLKLSFLEAVLSKGDRKLASVIYEAWRGGAKLDSWRECFNYFAWQHAFEKTGVDPYSYSHREIGEDELLPWDHIDTGIHKGFLQLERKKAREGVATPDCREQCPGCGLCANFGVKNILCI